MPNIQTLRVTATHFTGDPVRLITVIGPCLLIAEHLIIFRITLRINLLILDSLFANICKDGPIIVETILTGPHTVKALLISMIITSNHNTDDKTVLRKRLNEIGMTISCLRHTNYSTLWGRRTRTSTRLLHNLIDINRNTVTAKIFRTLQAGIR